MPIHPTVYYLCCRCEGEFGIPSPEKEQIIDCPHCKAKIRVRPTYRYEETWGEIVVETLAKITPQQAKELYLLPPSHEVYPTFPSAIIPVKYAVASTLLIGATTVGLWECIYLWITLLFSSNTIQPSLHPILSSIQFSSCAIGYLFLITAFVVMVGIGGILALRRRAYFFTIVASVFGLFVIGPVFICTVLSGLALILLIFSKKEFEEKPTRIKAVFDETWVKRCTSITIAAIFIISSVNFLALDWDADGLPNILEYFKGCGVFNSDSDYDGLSDGLEINTYRTKPLVADTDGDGLPDGWEVRYGLNPLNLTDSLGDIDNDGLTNLMEYQLKTYPNDIDTDDDGMPDGWEINYGLDPTNPLDAGMDKDNDNLTNLQEYFFNTNPTKPDTDDDGMPDWWEVVYGLGHTFNDSSLDLDGDNLTNLQEYSLGTKPNNNDTDGDILPDGWEFEYGFNPTISNDTDGDPDNDNLTNLQEYLNNTYPRNADTDNDGMPDGWEVEYDLYPDINDASLDYDNDNLTNIAEYGNGTEPDNPDTDNDTMYDGWEVEYRVFNSTLNKWTFDPNNSEDAFVDLDNDNLTNVQECLNNTNPNEWDTDSDSMSDGWEVYYQLDPLVNDSYSDYDNDNLTNVQEYRYNIPDYWLNETTLIKINRLIYGVWWNGTNPKREDTDNDGMPDGWEVKYGLKPLNPNDALSDDDSDGLTNAQEFALHSKPNSQDLFLEVDYMPDWGPSQDALDYFQSYYLTLNISVHITTTQVTEAELQNIGVSPSSLSATECRLIEEHFHDNPTTHVYVFYAKALDGTQLGWARYDFGAFIDRQCVNDVADQDWWYGWIPGVDDWTREEVDTCVLLHEVGHCINIIDWSENLTEVYCDNSWCVMAIFNDDTINGPHTYCAYHWSFRDLTDRWSVDEGG